MPRLVLGNKTDLGGEREVSAADGAAVAREMGCEFLECSALEDRNIEAAFHRVIDLIEVSEGNAFGDEREGKSGCLLM